MMTYLLTGLAMCAFAANSLLCRAALGADSIDAASFTSVRLAAGAVALWLLVRLSEPRASRTRRDWLAIAMLFAYAAAFSFAYLSLPAGTGALILFGCVQITMLIAGLHAGERLAPLGWAGFGLAVTGVAVLVAPGVRAPAPLGAALMGLAGVAWGLYSLRGRGNREPLQATAVNFLYAVPFALVLSALSVGHWHASPAGIALAAVSGAVTSGLGYVVWYAAVRRLDATQAAVVQLSVPAIAAAGGLLFLSEPLSLRWWLSSTAILGGIALVFAQRREAL